MTFLQRLDPELALVLDQQPLLDLADIPAARAERERLAAANRALTPVDPSVVRTDHWVPGLDDEPGVRVRVYRPDGWDEPLPVLYWMHGGGYVVGTVEQDDPVLERFVREVGCACVSVDWRHAPEHPYPHPLNDCYAGLRWAYRYAGDLGFDPARLAVGGSSSGAGSAAAVALLARDRGEVPIAFQLLTYPMIDDTNTTPASHAITHPRVWNRTKNVIAWRAYLGRDPDDDVSPYAAPARATDLSGLPPTFLGTGELDLFVDENITYAHRLLQAGVPTELHVYPGAIHGFDVFAPQTAVAGRLIRDRIDALRRAFEPRR
jgi:acetyl esterase/lipase